MLIWYFLSVKKDQWKRVEKKQERKKRKKIKEQEELLSQEKLLNDETIFAVKWLD